MNSIPYLNEDSKYHKDFFSNYVKDLPVESWNSVVFTDEKIVQSYNNGRLKCFRIRYSKKRGIGFDKR